MFKIASTKSTNEIEATDIALATGLATMMSGDIKIFFTFIINEILEIVDTANKVLQSRGEKNLVAALSVIKRATENDCQQIILTKRQLSMQLINPWKSIYVVKVLAKIRGKDPCRTI